MDFFEDDNYRIHDIEHMWLHLVLYIFGASFSLCSPYFR